MLRSQLFGLSSDLAFWGNTSRAATEDSNSVMCASNATTKATRLSRRAFVVGTVGTACSGALPLSSTSRASPAVPSTVMPRWLASEDSAFAVGATVGDLTFVAQDAAGPGDLPAGAAAQAERALQNLRRALAAVGQSADDLVFGATRTTAAGVLTDRC
jgi:enamine deaminase RidA (YjgF/YER057c/UK114 family)